MTLRNLVDFSLQDLNRLLVHECFRISKRFSLFSLIELIGTHNSNKRFSIARSIVSEK